MSDKKVVGFGSVIGFMDLANGVKVAELADVKGHYLLGDQPYVSTSYIVRIERNSDDNVIEIETKNTIYRKEVNENG
jgi:hypothetical protein